MTTLTPLNVPAIRSESGTFSRFTPERLAQWLGRLPRGDPDACAGILLRELGDMNRAPLLKLSRFHAAEALRPTVNDITEALVKRYRAAELPLTPELEGTADTVQGLLRELAIAFRHAVNGWLDGRQLGGDQRTEAQIAMQRTLLAQGRALLEAYRTYMPEPQGFWQTLHTLYARAEALHLQAAPIEATRDSDETALSVKQAYVRVLILSLANPYHLMQGEAEELYRRIGRWVHFARLTRPTDNRLMSGAFVVDLGSDFPPRYVARQQLRNTPATEPRLLEVGQLVATLNRQIMQLDEDIRRSPHTGSLSQRLQRNMYQRFQNALGGRQERTAERHSTMARVRLVDGLARCHFMLNDQQPFRPEADELRWQRKVTHASRGAGLTLADDNVSRAAASSGSRTAQFRTHGPEADDVWARANRLEISTEDEEEASETAPAVTSAIFSRKNESRRGMAVFHPKECPLRTRVGELVAYGDPQGGDTPGQWRLAAIRWLRTRSERGLDMGLEFLADSGHAAASKAIKGPGAGSSYMRTLIVPRVNPLTRPATLITPANVYAVGTRLALNLGEVVVQVQLTELLESTHLYAHFRYRLSPAEDDDR